MALVGLLMALLAMALLIGRFSGGSAPQPPGRAAAPGAAPSLTEPAPPNPAATLRSVEQVGAASAEVNKQHVEEAKKAMQ